MKRSFKMLAVASMVAFAACGGDDTDVGDEPNTQIPASPAPAPAPDSATMPDSMTMPDSNMVSTGL
jgi:hypothetical protein